eukprot:TRINITY_DN16907_c0_g1_i1.p1 TRINITY_DN16907_c0_g1~~TRINITY_DN16907_c0_g1_i1.p1  ORF type:complete len:311 (+),score=81.27 TRINITY_DN16907_c0_g1_i1:80-1012(+)
MQLRFDDRVAIVTGGGGGLGKAYALELARRGAAVLVNDLGGVAQGGLRPADAVVAEIRAAGGRAAASYDSVEHGERIVAAALSAFGRVDMLVNNAGIVRGGPFRAMAESDWDMVMRVHLRGAYAVTKAAWRHMQERKYGRIVNVSSMAGMQGYGGEAAYSTAKMGIVGFTQTLAKEGARSGIHANIVAPLAGTQMLADWNKIHRISMGGVDPMKTLSPDYITPLVVYLLHESCTENGSIYDCAAGVFQRIQLARAAGYAHDIGASCPTPEDVAANWSTVNDMRDHAVLSYKNRITENAAIMANLRKAARL